MQKFGCTVVLLLLLAGTSHAAEEAKRKVADVGNGRVLSCGSGSTSFEIDRTAVPTVFEGQLQMGGQRLALKCNRLNEKPSNHYNLWDCEEMRAGEGLMSVMVDGGGMTGGVNATVSQAQMFPLHPKVLASISCGAH